MTLGETDTEGHRNTGRDRYRGAQRHWERQIQRDTETLGETDTEGHRDTGRDRYRETQ